MVLLTVAVGCGETHYDSRLAAIDSIIESSPDSALALLRAMPRGSITRGDDRAYYALLLTEARYKCYDSIASTDTIDLALDHFASSGDRLKLTRALIYKGAVLEELGNPTDAMRLYKQAEETALPTDYHNLGYANLRMAVLYHNSFASGREYIDKYLKALHFFELDSSLEMKLVVLSRLGSVYRGFRNDSSYFYLNKAILLADSLNDSVAYFSNVSILSRAYYTDSLFEKLKANDLYAIQRGSEYVTRDIYHDLIRVYSVEGKLDSAKLYLPKIDNSHNNCVEFLSYLYTMRLYSSAKGDYKQAFNYAQLDEKLSDSLRNVRNSAIISKTETEYERKNAELKAAVIKSKSIVALSILLLFIAILSFIIIVLRMRYRANLLSNQLLIANLKEEYHEVETTLRNKMIEIEQSKKHMEISDFAIKSLQEAFETQLKKIQKVIKLSENASILQNSILGKRINSVLFSKMDEKEIESLIKYVNLQFNNAIDRLIAKYPELTPTDIKIITMMYLGYPNSYICVFMGYTNKQSVINRRLIIAQKMGIQCQLQEYLNRF